MIDDCYYYSRKFLNSESAGGTAFIEGKVRPAGGEDDNKFEAELVLADCNRLITLDFGLYSPDDSERVKELRYKIRQLKTQVNQFLAAVNERLEGL